MSTRLGLLRDALLALVFHVAPRFANVIIFIVIGRLAGPAQAGVFSLATTYLLIITTVMRGLDDLLIRQVAREPDRAANYFGNFLLLRTILSAAIYLALVLIVQDVLNYAASTVTPIVILTLSVLPDSLAYVAQSILLGQRRFGAPAAIWGGVSAFKLAAGTIALWQGGGLVEIAWLWLIGSGLGMAALIGVAAQQVGGLQRADWLNFGPLRMHWRTALSFTAITVLTALDSQTDTVLLSVFRNETEVGWYGAATTVTFSLLMLSQAYRFAVYPLLTRYAQSAPEKLSPLFQKSIHYMGVLALPMVAGIIWLAPALVDLIFKPQFAPASLALRTIVLSLLFFFLSEPCNRLMLVKDRQQVIVKILLISTGLNIGFNLILIPLFGAAGSGLSRSISAGVYFILNYSYIVKTNLAKARPFSLYKPVFASAVMLLSLIVLESIGLLPSIAFGAIAYATCLWLIDDTFKGDIMSVISSLPRKSGYINH